MPLRAKQIFTTLVQLERVSAHPLTLMAQLNHSALRHGLLVARSPRAGRPRAARRSVGARSRIARSIAGGSTGSRLARRRSALPICMFADGGPTPRSAASMKLPKSYLMYLLVMIGTKRVSRVGKPHAHYCALSHLRRATASCSCGIL